MKVKLSMNPKPTSIEKNPVETDNNGKYEFKFKGLDTITYKC